MRDSNLKKAFELQLANNVIEMKQYDRFSKLEQILSSNGYFEGARILINKSDTTGLRDLLLAGRPDLSIEGLVLKPEFRELFEEDELKKCKRKLGY